MACAALPRRDGARRSTAERPNTAGEAQQAEQAPGKLKAFEQVLLPSRIGAAAPAVVQRQTRVTPLLPPQPTPLVEHLLPVNETAAAVPLRQAA